MCIFLFKTPVLLSNIIFLWAQDVYFQDLWLWSLSDIQISNRWFCLAGQGVTFSLDAPRGQTCKKCGELEHRVHPGTYEWGK